MDARYPSTGIGPLPVELLTEVFMIHYAMSPLVHAGDLKYIHRTPLHTSDWMNILLVSRGWHDIAQEISSLWSSVSVGGNMDWPRTCLSRVRRMKKRAIDLYIHCKADMDPPDELLELLPEHASRLRSLTMLYESNDPEWSDMQVFQWVDFQVDLFSSGLPFQSVSFFDVTESTYDVGLPFVLDDLQIERLPEITALSVDGLPPPMNPELYARLETLELGNIYDQGSDGEWPFTWQHVFDFMFLCTNLRQLKMDGFLRDSLLNDFDNDGNAEGPIVTFPRLEHLWLRHEDRLHAAFLAHLNLPALVELSVTDDIACALSNSGIMNPFYYTLADMLPLSTSLNLHDAHPTLRKLDTILLSSTLDTHALRLSQTAEHAEASPMGSIARPRVDIVLDKSGSDYSRDRQFWLRQCKLDRTFNDLLSPCVRKAGNIIARLPLTTLVLDLTYALVLHAAPWRVLLAALPLLRNLRLQGFGREADAPLRVLARDDALCPLLARVSVGDAPSLVAADHALFRALVRLVARRPGRIAVGLRVVHRDAEGLQRLWAKYGPAIERCARGAVAVVRVRVEDPVDREEALLWPLCPAQNRAACQMLVFTEPEEMFGAELDGYLAEDVDMGDADGSDEAATGSEDGSGSEDGTEEDEEMETGDEDD
ncbi:uncharacterized protein BXZ73DRAFT_82062 [Epithele typhae]|uniref:uncharacterized protein n=1 Tax=Epithele typhae TaxID=378194 RepID=UPI0020073D4F|nr:uncharacterized protein BXZ73DRAFT_82062 [Epithele typhae]KAH9912969.1 hypothetical protein BXZ73DRAFT_82062 [Epithele typhae]